MAEKSSDLIAILHQNLPQGTEETMAKPTHYFLHPG
jgi:hypothetical protein